MSEGLDSHPFDRDVNQGNRIETVLSWRGVSKEIDQALTQRQRWGLLCSTRAFPPQNQHNKRNTLHPTGCNQWSVQYFSHFLFRNNRWSLSTPICWLCSKLNVGKSHQEKPLGFIVLNCCREGHVGWDDRGENALFLKMEGLLCCFILFYSFPFLPADRKSILSPKHCFPVCFV